MWTYVTVFVLLGLATLAAAQSDAELNARTKLVWDADDDRLCDHDLLFNTTAGPGARLFRYVNEDKLTTPTWTLFKELLDAYNINEGEPDVCDSACVAKEYEFVDALLATRPIDLAREFIAQYDASLSDPAAFRSWLWRIWFLPYNRHAANDSSGFQHVFQGELKVEGNDVGGFHNWYQIYKEEVAGNFVYGEPTGLCNPDVPRFNLQWYGHPKSIDSVTVRSSPEADIAIFTLLFKFRPNQAYTCVLDNYEVPIQTWDEFIATDDYVIGSAYVRC